MVFASDRGIDYKHLFEGLPGLYLVLNPDFTIVTASDAYLAATMTRREDIIGQKIFDVFPANPDDDAAVGVNSISASLNRVKENLVADALPILQYDIRRPEEEGGGFEERHWAPVNSPILNAKGKLVYIVHSVEDVTEYVMAKRTGIAMERVAKQMEAQAFSSNEELQGFTYSIAHDMRKYLRSIAITARSIALDIPERISLEVAENLEELERNARQAASLVDGLLDLTRQREHHLQKGPVDVSLLCQEIAEIEQTRERPYPIVFSIEEGMKVEGDEQLLKILLENLIDNACKYHEKTDESAFVEVGRIQVEDIGIFFVRDNGVGFDMTYVDKLFKPFERLHRDKDFDGTGIGLANVKRIVHRHGGQIWALSEVGKGTTFFFTLGGLVHEGEAVVSVPYVEQLYARHASIAS